MIRFCRAIEIAARDMSSDFSSVGPKARHRILEHVLFRRENREWKARGADCGPISADAKRSTEKKVKVADSSAVRMSFLFFRLPLLRKSYSLLRSIVACRANVDGKQPYTLSRKKTRPEAVKTTVYFVFETAD